MNDFDNKQICSYKDIDRFGFTCDVCGRKVNGCSIVNGMKFCAKCYQETFGKDNQQNEIQQIKQQLEEKDEQIKKRVMVYEKQFIEQTDEIYSLKQQLAEKDIRIEELEGQFAYECECNKQLVELQKQLAEKDKEIERLKVFEEAYYFNQTQVSQESMDLLLQNAYQVHNETQLAIQELEKIERLLYESHYKEIDNKYYAEYEDINNLIDSRIKALEELKGEQT